MPSRNLLSRILKIEPGVSFGQWIYDRISNNWDRLAALFVATGGMSYLASITQWVEAWGPFGIGTAGILSGLAIWVGIALAQSLRAKAEERRSQAALYAALAQQPKTVNPLADTFDKVRLSAQDFFRPWEIQVV